MFSDEFNIPDEKMIVERFKAVMEQQGMTMSTLKEKLDWSFPKLSKVMSGVQNAKFSELTQIALAIGYPLEAFMQQEFSLTDYERENPPMSLRGCFETYFEGYPCDDVTEEMIATEIPYALRKILNLNWRQFSIKDRLLKFEDPFTSNEMFSYGFHSQVYIRPQELYTKEDDVLEMGYWFGIDKQSVALAIIYVPDRKLNGNYSNRKREAYNTFTRGMPTEGFDEIYQELDIFGPSLMHGQICSIVYDFSKGYTEERLIEDLNKMFKTYRALLRDTAKESELYVWDKKAEENLSIKPMYEEPLICGSEVVDAEAREMCGYHCDIDPAHKTFTGKDGNQYVDVIRLVPLKMQQEFTVNLDSVENAVCLCPNCMSQIVYGCDHDRDDILVKIYYNNRQKLENAGLDIPLSRLLGMYMK